MSKPNTSKLHCGFCVYVSICIAIIRSSIYRMAYDALHRAMHQCVYVCALHIRVRCTECQKLCTAGLVGAKRTIAGCEASPVHSFYFFVLILLSFCFYGGLTSLLFSLSKSLVVGFVQHLFLHFTPLNMYIAKAQLHVFPVLHRQETSPQLRPP